MECSWCISLGRYGTSGLTGYIKETSVNVKGYNISYFIYLWSGLESRMAADCDCINSFQLAAAKCPNYKGLKPCSLTGVWLCINENVIDLRSRH